MVTVPLAPVTVSPVVAPTLVKLLAARVAAMAPPVACPDWIYNNRNQVERLWARLKEWRAIATRYEKTAVSFMGVLSLAAALDWLRR